MSTSNQDREFGSYFLDDIREWIGRNLNPDDVFSMKDLRLSVQSGSDPEDVFENSALESWATENGWVKE